MTNFYRKFCDGPRLYDWLVVLSCLLGSVGNCYARAPLIAAAADLNFALTEINTRFRAETGHEITPVFGSSGNFYRQILQGAPFQLFLSADEELVFKLAEADKTLDRGRLYAIGRLVLLLPSDSPLKLDGQLQDLVAAVGDGRLTKFAIANPAHAPYGQRAQEVLQRVGLWSKIQPQLVLGENAAQAAQFAISGSTQGGLVAYSLALTPALAKLGHSVLIPQQWHTPLKQRMVLLAGADDTAHAFYAYLQTPTARKILQRNGFTIPNE